MGSNLNYPEILSSLYSHVYTQIDRNVMLITNIYTILPKRMSQNEIQLDMRSNVIFILKLSET